MALFKPFRGTRAALDTQEKHDGYAYFCTDDGTFHIDYVDADGNLQRKQINAKDAETLGLKSADEFVLKDEMPQPDWSASEGEKGYIENRTHYKSKVWVDWLEEFTVTTVVNTTGVCGSNTVFFDDTPDVNHICFIVGDTYEVTYDGKVYYCEAFTPLASGNIKQPAVGNASLRGQANLTGGDSTLPFFIFFPYVDSGDTVMVGTDTAGEHTFSVRRAEGYVYNTLDPNFIADEQRADKLEERLPNIIDSAFEEKIANSIDNLPTPDWSSVEGEAGYIENRTHYKESGWVDWIGEFTTETIVNTTGVCGSNTVFFDDTPDVNHICFIVGDTYEVTYDGKVYYCEAFTPLASGNIKQPAVGNASLRGQANLTGGDSTLPFFIFFPYVDSGDAVMVGTDTAGEHTFSVRRVVDYVYHTLDPNFIADEQRADKLPTFDLTIEGKDGIIRTYRVYGFEVTE